MRGSLTRARALAVFAIAFGVLGALGIAPGFAGAEEPPVPPPPDYEYDVLPGIQPGYTVDAMASALADRNLELTCGWHGACYDYRPPAHPRGLRYTDTDGPGIDIRSTAGTSVYAAFRAVRLDARAGALTATVREVVGRMDGGGGCMKLIVSVYDGTNEVARLRYTHTDASIEEDTPIALPTSVRDLSAYQLTKVGELVALGADPHCSTIPPHLHFGRGDRFSGATLHHNRTVFTATTANARAVEAAGDVDMASGTLTGLGFPKGHHPDAGGRRTDPRLTAMQRGTALYAFPKFCSDTWVLKIQPASRSAPPPSDVEPCAPSGLRVTSGAGRLAASWDDPGDSSISGYEIRYKAREANWPADSQGGGWAAIGAVTSRAITGLTNETAYDVQVRAVVRHGSAAARFLRGPAASASGSPTPDTRCTVSVSIVDGDGRPLNVAGVGVSGGGAGACGTRTLTAELKNGNYAFTRWTISPAVGLTRVCATFSTTCTLKFGTGPGSAHTVAVTATFTRKQCTVAGRVSTLNRAGDVDSSLTGGTVSANAEDAESATVPCGDNVTLTAKAASGYEFVRWSGCTSVAANGTACTVTTSGLTLAAYATATFRQIPLPPTYLVTVKKAGSGTGTVDPGSGRYRYSQTFIANPTGDSTFGGWSGCDSVDDTACSVTVTGARVITATFAPPQCSVTVAKGTGGSATNSGTKSGDCPVSVTTTATPDAEMGYTFNRWSGDSSSTSHTITVTATASSPTKSVTATFTPPQCSVSVAADPGGSATNRGTKSGDCPVSVPTTATPNTAQGYTFNRWSGDSNSTSRTITVTATASSPNKSVTATFTPPQCSLSVTDGAGGSAEITSGGATGDCGRSVTIRATADDNYRFSGWSGDVSGAQSPKTVTVNKTSMSAHASFKEQCTVVAAGSTGGTASGGDTVDCGKTVTLRATAKAGYCFNYWQQPLPPEEFARQTTSGSCPTTDSISVTTSSGNVIYQAVFRAKRSYTLSVSVVPRGAGSVPGAGSYTEGTPVTLTAKAVAPYYLKAWSGCDSSSGTTCKVTMNRNRTVTASFDNLCESVPGLCARAESE